MLFVECEGTPYEIGFQHGSSAREHITRSIAFYATLFQQNCKQSWPEVLHHASQFEQQAKSKWPAYHEEMRGIADGAGKELLDIVAINVRTEINFGLFSDGCTALAWHTEGRAWMGQNWDWLPAQKQNLIITKISQPSKPTILQVTEAGILGKIGFNSSSLGVLFTAIRVHGVSPTNLPAHLGLRKALESTSVASAIRALESAGMASSAHILLGDTATAVGVEFTKSTFRYCELDASGSVVHTNHLLKEHPGEVEAPWLADSGARLATMRENMGRLGGEPSWGAVEGLFEDEGNLPGAICRVRSGEMGSETLFNIVMDLKERRAVVRLGRPTQVEERVVLQL
ncbi:hypothetical protein M3J09_012516 [Ascochyta lentis]